MNLILPSDILDIAQKFDQKRFQFYLVGGAVRDFLLGKPIKDWDFTTDATPEEILEIIPNGFNNNQFGTVGYVIKDESNSESSTTIEITTMRKEDDYTDNRHPDKVSWTNDIEEDLQRRDFTINAMAILIKNQDSLNDIQKNIVDPFKGQADLAGKVIRAVGDPNKRFQEDALRLMRAIRFATQLQFMIEEITFKAVQENSQLLKNISWERIRDELLKILSSEYPYEGVVMLRNANLLQYILPEVEACFGIVQEGPKHDRIYDIGEHSLLSLKFCPSNDPIVRLATLIHDTGKVETMSVQEDGNVTFYNHDLAGGKVAAEVCKRLRLSNKDSERIYKLVRFHMFTVNEDQTDSAIRRFIKNIGAENIQDMMDVRVGDRLGGGTQKAESWRMTKFKERMEEVMQKPFSVSDLKVSGTDVMQILNIPPSRKVGEILDELFQEVLEDAEKNNREYLEEKIKKYTF